MVIKDVLCEDITVLNIIKVFIIHGNLGLPFLQQQQHANQEILTLKQHIQILQQEHLSKISRIAELEAQLQCLKVIFI